MTKPRGERCRSAASRSALLTRAWILRLRVRSIAPSASRSIALSAAQRSMIRMILRHARLNLYALAWW
jgi:hypothetical protein